MFARNTRGLCHRFTRRSVLGGAAGAALSAPFIARAAEDPEIVWRIGHSAPADFALHVRLVEAAGEIAARTGGKMQLKVFANSELGGPVGLLSQVRAGKVDIAPVTGQLLATNLTLAALPMVGFAFASYDRVWAALDGELGTFIRARIKERLGLVAMDRCWNFGIRQITTNGMSIRSATDIQGVRLRTPAEADFISLFHALNAVPVAMPLGDLATALHTRAVDGQEGVLPLVKAARLDRYQSACALTNHVWDGHWMCIADRSWANLPDDFKPIVATALNNGGLNQRKDTVEADIAARRELEAAGMVFNEVNVDTFRSVLRGAGYYAAWRTKVGDEGWAALEKHSGHLV